MDTGDRIRFAREFAILGRGEFGDALDVTYETVRSWEAGASTPRHKRFAEIASLTGVIEAWLASGSGPAYYDEGGHGQRPVLHEDGEFLTEIVGTEADYEINQAMRDIRSYGRTVRRVPMIDWVAAGHQSVAISELDDGRSWVAAFDVSTRAYALTVHGDSMTNLYGRSSFPDGTVIVVDPEQVLLNGRFVIAKLPEDSEAMFRRYEKEGGQVWLRPLNPEYAPILIKSEMLVCGVVVGKAYERLV